MSDLIYILEEMISKENYERVRRIIDLRIKYFKEIGRSPIERKFIELSFCILTANYRADKAIMIQRIIWDGFLYLSLSDLKKKLKKLGYRYPSSRAEFIVEARYRIHDIEEILNSDLNSKLKRVRLVSLIRGLGMKEASHFLRNIGYDDLAIIDRHVLSLLKKYNYIDEITRLSNRRYIEIENILRSIGDFIGTPLSKLDLYLWYLTTRTIMK